MIQYFSFNKNRGNMQIRLRKKNRVTDKAKESYISKKANILILGVEASGKTHKLETFKRKAHELWKNYEIITFSASDSISEILMRNLKEAEIKKYFTADINLESGEECKVDFGKQYIKIQALVNKAKNAVLIIDDLNKFTGKKLEILKDLLRNCKQFVATAYSENSIHKTISNIINKRQQKKEVIMLSSSASLDATNILFGIIIVGLFLTGLTEVAILIMAARLFMRGSK